MTQIVLTLPVLSANKYWRPAKIGNRMTIVPTKEAKQYKTEVVRLARAAGVVAPIKGRTQLEIWLYPHRPIDWQKRQRQHGAAWDDTVQCIDLGNCEKVLSDALNGVCFEDDSWHRRIIKQRMEPDGKGYRVVVRITAIDVPKPQLELTA
jgi:crossover junction endodeoxyribonuclease RusA